MGLSAVHAVAKPALGPALRPELLTLHDDHRRFDSFEQFQEQLQELMRLGKHIDAATTCVTLLGLFEPLTQQLIEPRQIGLAGTNVRE